MRSFNLFSLIIVLSVAFMTWSSVASAATTVHVLENLDSKEAKMVRNLMMEKGYIVSEKPMFSESNQTVVITKTVETEVDQPSVQVEVMKMEGNIPKSVYHMTVATDDVSKALQQMPSSKEIKAQLQAKTNN